MSIILKKIDMPKEGELHLIVTKNGIIYGAEYPKVRHTYPLNLDAEAIQIPKNHGNLKDENEIKKNSIDDDYDLYVSWTDIDNAPTILEAEE